jgi:hypothetical protein
MNKKGYNVLKKHRKRMRKMKEKIKVMRSQKKPAKG